MEMDFLRFCGRLVGWRGRLPPCTQYGTSSHIPKHTIGIFGAPPSLPSDRSQHFCYLFFIILKFRAPPEDPLMRNFSFYVDKGVYNMLLKCGGENGTIN